MTKTPPLMTAFAVAAAAGITLLNAGDARAAIIGFTGANAQVAAVDAGVLGAITEPADGTVITELVYTVSGLTIDADGTLNDSVTITVPISGTGPVSWDDNNNGVREFDVSGGALNDAGEGITFGAITVSGTGSGGLGYQLDSALYTEFTVRRFGNGDVYTIAGDATAATVTQGTNDPEVVLNDNFFTATYSAGNGVNPTDVDFTVNVTSIPEPASLALLGVGGLLMLGRRR